jgi:hypothetical protein
MLKNSKKIYISHVKYKEYIEQYKSKFEYIKLCFLSQPHQRAC